MFYFIKIPEWLKKIYSSCIWQIPTKQKIIYLSFDDGPHEVATPFVLATLKKYNAKGTFFCIGKNVVAHLHLYHQIINEGHAVGNHTFNHINGWKNKAGVYLENIAQAKKVIDSNLFRPPYGKISFAQIRAISKHDNAVKIIMWSVLSADFDSNVLKEQCVKNVIDNAVNGSIIVFHDSEKAFENLKFTLPKVLEYFNQRGYEFRKIEY